MRLEVSRRSYRLLLRFLPADFRRRHCTDLETSFAEILRDAREQSGRRAVAAVWAHGVADLLLHAIRLRFSSAPRVSSERRVGAGPGPDNGGMMGPPGGKGRSRSPLLSTVEAAHGEIVLALRSLRRSPGFALVAVTTLGLGIGLNVAVFGVVNSVLRRALPYPEPNRLVQLWGTVENQLTVWGNASLPDLEDWRKATSSFDALAGFSDDRLPFNGASEPALVDVGRVTESFFEVLGIEAALGRLLQPEDFREDAGPAVVISNSAWRDRFGSATDVLGRAVRLDDDTYTIVGVLPPREHSLPTTGTDFWIPQEPGMHRGSRSLSAIGRLADGVSLAAAQADMDAIAAVLAAEHPDDNAARALRLMPLKNIVVGDAARPLLVLFGATGFVLIIAGVNIVNLFHARSFDRRRELTIRVALGSSRVRLLTHVGAEAVVLALCGGVFGAFAAYVAVDAFVALAPTEMPRLDEVRFDGATLLFATSVSLLVAVLVGIVPALRASASRRSFTASSSPGRDWRGWLIAAEVALSVVLVVGATLFARSFTRLQNVDKGFDAEGVLAFRLALPASRYPTAPDVLTFHQKMLDDIAALPETASVGAVTVLPFTSASLSSDVVVDGEAREDLQVEFRSVSHDYFATMGMTLLAGRSTGPQDTSDALGAAVVNRALARSAWPGADPVGRTIAIFGRVWSVVGVVGDVRHFGLDVPPGPEMYVSFLQQPRRYLTYTVRSSGDPAHLFGTLRGLVQAADPELPIADLATMSERVWASAAAPRFRTGVLGTLAGTALLLAVVGVYGGLSFAVSRRVREIGIRRALGARTGSVMRMVVRRGMFFAIVGAGTGAALAAALAGSVQSLLFEVEPLDPPTFATALAIICGAALLGCLVPALRAAAVDPAAVIANTNQPP